MQYVSKLRKLNNKQAILRIQEALNEWDNKSNKNLRKALDMEYEKLHKKSEGNSDKAAAEPDGTPEGNSNEASCKPNEKSLNTRDYKFNNYINRINFKHRYRKLWHYNFQNVLSALYSFESVVNVIDYEIQISLNGEDKESVSKVQFGGHIIWVKENPLIKHKLFIDEWRTLDDIKFSTQQIKDLKLTSTEVLRLRCANYRGFINKIKFEVNNLGYLIFELD